MQIEKIVLNLLNKWYRDAAQPIYRYQVMRTPAWVLIIGAITLMVIQTNVNRYFKELEKMADKVNIEELSKVEIARFEKMETEVSTLLLIPPGLSVTFRFLFFIFSYHLMRGLVVDSYKNTYLKMLAQAGPALDQQEKLKIECSWVNIQTRKDYELLIDYLKRKRASQSHLFSATGTT